MRSGMAIYICKSCQKSARLAWTPKLEARRPQVSTDAFGCDRCPFRRLCGYRLQLDPAAWVLCEIPDALDLNTASDEAVEEFELWTQKGQKSKRARRRLQRAS